MVVGGLGVGMLFIGEMMRIIGGILVMMLGVVVLVFRVDYLFFVWIWFVVVVYEVEVI